jgi:hypothetical protein
VQLHSTGEVKVKNLWSNSIIAASSIPPSFDSNASHCLEVAFKSTSLQVMLDGRAVLFDQERRTTDIFIPGTNLPRETGTGNQGTIGIAFGAELNRGQIGGQRADNRRFTTYAPLTARRVRGERNS